MHFAEATPTSGSTLQQKNGVLTSGEFDSDVEVLILEFERLQQSALGDANRLRTVTWQSHDRNSGSASKSLSLIQSSSFGAINTFGVDQANSSSKR